MDSPKNVTCLLSAMSALTSAEAPRGAEDLQWTRKKALMWLPVLKSPRRVRYRPPELSGTAGYCVAKAASGIQLTYSQAGTDREPSSGPNQTLWRA